MRTSERSASRASPRRRAAAGAGAVSIPLHEPTFSGREWSYVRACLESGWVSSAGPLVARFERAVADYVGARHAVATVTGSAALHLALQLAGVQPGEDVLVPDLTFVAPVHAVRQCGAHPVLIDADPDTWQMDPDQMADFLARECVVRSGATFDRRSGRRVRAVVAVHLLGLACEIDRVVEIARRHRLAVIEDAAQAIGVRYRGRHVGTFGDLGVLSFNGNKIVTAGGGGMLITGNARLAARARRLANHGREGTGEEIREIVGFNYRLSNLQAALGLAQIERIDALLALKKRIALRYERELGGAHGVTPMPTPARTRPSFWLYTIRLASTTARRDEVVRRLRERGVGAAPLWPPVSLQDGSRCVRAHRLEHSRRLYAQSICLPSSPSLSESEQGLCITALRDALRPQRATRARPA